jgi:hypothetical protein
MIMQRLGAKRHIKLPTRATVPIVTNTGMVQLTADISIPVVATQTGSLTPSSGFTRKAPKLADRKIRGRLGLPIGK